MIRTAEYAGFCFGVSRAVKTVYELASRADERIYTLGDLIHNPVVISELEHSGVRSITAEEIDGAAASASESSPVTAVIRTHGIEKAISEKLYRLAEQHAYFSV